MRLIALLLAIIATPAFAEAPAFRLDHAWIAVSPGAPERAALEKAGFRIAPTVNRHEEQGTASVTVEFANGFLELLWPDDSVSLAPALAVAKQKFVARSSWRTTGWSPFAVALRRTASTPLALPFETWRIGAAWMAPGESIEMLTPRASTAVSLFVPPHGVDDAANAAAIANGGDGAKPFLHPNGARRLTALRIIAPNAQGLPPSADYVRASGAVALDVGGEWLMEMTLDDAKQKKVTDLRPTLPLVIRY